MCVIPHEPMFFFTWPVMDQAKEAKTSEAKVGESKESDEGSVEGSRGDFSKNRRGGSKISIYLMVGVN